MDAIAQVVEAISNTANHAQMAATFSAADVESATKAAILAEMAEEYSRLAVEMAKPPKPAEPVGPVEPAKPAEAAEAVEPAQPVEPAETAEPAPKRQRTCTNCSCAELRAEEVEVLTQANEQAEPHDAGERDRYLEAGIDSHFQVEESPSPLPLDSPLNSPDSP